MTPKVSIVVPVYNVEKYLAECLNSAIHQTMQEIEIICINDGSTDHSAAILSEYAGKDQRIQIITTENHGLGAARNTGMRRATGKYIYFLDSDDIIEPEAMEECHALAEKFRADVILFGERIINECKSRPVHPWTRPLQFCQRVTSGVKLVKNLFDVNNLPVLAQCHFFNFDFIRKNEIFMPEGIFHEDNYFTIKALLKADRVYMTDRQYFTHRLREGSIITSGAARDGSFPHLLGYFTVYRMFCEDCESTTLNTKQKELIKHKMVSILQVICMGISKSSDEQAKELISRCMTPALLRFWMRETKNNESLKKEKQQLEAEIEKEKKRFDAERQKVKLYKESLRRRDRKLRELQSSVSFRLGRAVTWPLRMVRNTFRCYRENGFVYTLKRIPAKFAVLRKKSL